MAGEQVIRERDVQGSSTGPGTAAAERFALAGCERDKLAIAICTWINIAR